MSDPRNPFARPEAIAQQAYNDEVRRHFPGQLWLSAQLTIKIEEAGIKAAMAALEREFKKAAEPWIARLYDIEARKPHVWRQGGRGGPMEPP